VLPGEAESTVAVLVKRSACPFTLDRKESAPARMEKYASLSSSLRSLDSLRQHRDVLFGLLGRSYSAYSNKNTCNFLGIQTYICMQ